MAWSRSGVRLKLSPEAENALRDCATRWGVTLDEAALWCFTSGFHRLSSVSVAPEHFVNPLDEEADSAPVVRFANALLVTAIDAGCETALLQWDEKTLVAEGTAGETPVSLWPIPPWEEGTQAPRLDLHAHAVAALGGGWHQAVWLRFCEMCSVGLGGYPATQSGYILLRWNNRDWRVEATFRPESAERKSLALTFINESPRRRAEPETS